MKRKLIQDAWLSYRDAVLPAGAPSVQITECRRAFYAGAQAFFSATMTAFDPTTSDATDGDVTLLADMQMELEQFCEQVKQGVA
jgi:hypothetical protein